MKASLPAALPAALLAVAASARPIPCYLAASPLRARLQPAHAFSTVVEVALRLISMRLISIGAPPAAAARRSPGRRSLVHTAPLHGEFLYAVTPFVASLQVTISISSQDPSIGVKGPIDRRDRKRTERKCTLLID